MTHKALQNVVAFWQVINNQLMLGPKKVADVADEHGTPFYAYDLQIAQSKLDRLRAALPAEIGIHYAIKANPHPAVIEMFGQSGCGFDVASAGELLTALSSGVEPSVIGFAGPGKRPEEIRLACRKGIGSLNVESEQELFLADRIAQEQGKKLHTSLRINPQFDLQGSGMRMGGGPKQFGIDQEQAAAILKRFREWPNLDFLGFHIFAGSQNLKADSITQALTGAMEIVDGFLPDCPRRPQFVNLGGGFGIPYFFADEELDIEAVGTALKQIKTRKIDHLQDISLAVETGRYLVGECGIYVTRILYRKESRGEVFLVCDGGMHHHLAASGNFGQVIKKNFPVALPEKMEQASVETVNIVGPLCTPLDRIAMKVDLPKADPGDLLAVFCSGAYGLTASPFGFLGHPRPKEIVVRDGKIHADEDDLTRNSFG
ncbi:MAG: pyridoxal-dependent decarboxylase, exosortase A system-associated [Desulfohalobiaceae bacterium]|nr:pyridoxal-dependent decarboxylase, exosortase A system-associated [Desulfohalobiaceae bacterium]